VFSSDHYLENTVTEEIKKATALCEEDIVIFGVPPASPHTGYGYIAPGDDLSPGFRVVAFKEKPDLKTATKYLSEGYFWNSGMFLFRIPVFFSELKRYLPELLDAFSESGCIDYLSLPSISIDRGLLEHSTNIVMIPLASTWTDLGTFKSWYEIAEKDADQNVGVHITKNARRNFVESGDKDVVLIDVNDTIVVDTDDALLICNMDSSEQIGEIVKQLATKKDPRLDIHSKVYRPWGSYHLLEKGNRYLMKKITVEPGNKLSLQRHHHRSEHWIVVTGMADVILDDAYLVLRPGESTFVPAGIRHRLANSGKIPLVVIEVQIGEYLEEDDIERYEDDFGRECGPNNILIGMEEKM
jgi:mannose-1-phosphate guanylyltransferase/mannose-6-phosphate isomerase